MKRAPATLFFDTFILLICIIAVLLISSRTFSQGGGYLQVQTYNGTYRYSMALDREITVQGPLGDTTIIIEHGEAHIHDSACPTKSCTQQRAISNPRGWIACLPNQVLLTIVGDNGNAVEVDDVAN